MPKLITEIQLELVNKLGADFLECSLDLKLGLSPNVFSANGPIHGLRHPLEGDTSGWYIWSGELSHTPDFFQPFHVQHLIKKLPILIPYLGLAPGWRFIIDHEEYEDVWEDPSLLVLD